MRIYPSINTDRYIDIYYNNYNMCNYTFLASAN